VPEERLQKIISQAGVTSRRAAEEYIKSGRITVNGKTVTELGTKADTAKDTIAVDGVTLDLGEGPRVVIMMHKPAKVMVTVSDPQGRTTVLQLLDRRAFQGMGPISCRASIRSVASTTTRKACCSSRTTASWPTSSRTRAGACVARIWPR